RGQREQRDPVPQQMIAAQRAGTDHAEPLGPDLRELACELHFRPEIDVQRVRDGYVATRVPGVANAQQYGQRLYQIPIGVDIDRWWRQFTACAQQWRGLLAERFR